MENIWKITNTEKSTPIKVSIALSSTMAPGIILEPNECVLAFAQMTRALDIQNKRGYVTIEDFDNSKLKLPLGKPFKVSILDKAVQELQEYIN